MNQKNEESLILLAAYNGGSLIYVQLVSIL